MNAKELVGKMAIRSSHVMHPNGRIDYSYTDEPIFVKNATDEYIIFTYPQKSKLSSEKLHILGHEFCDDNWDNYDQLDERDYEKIYVVTKSNSISDIDRIYVGAFKTLEVARRSVLDIYPDADEYWEDRRGYHYWFKYNKYKNVGTCILIHEEEIQ